MKILTWQNPGQLFVAQELINKVKSKCCGIKGYEKAEVSTEGNLTDEEKGQLRFKDGVTQTRVMVKATIEHVDKNGDVKLAFYLSSKAECEGAQEEIGLKTKEVEEED